MPLRGALTRRVDRRSRATGSIGARASGDARTRRHRVPVAALQSLPEELAVQVAPVGRGGSRRDAAAARCRPARDRGPRAASDAPRRARATGPALRGAQRRVAPGRAHVAPASRDAPPRRPRLRRAPRGRAAARRARSRARARISSCPATLVASPSTPITSPVDARGAPRRAGDRFAPFGGTG